MRNRVLPLVLVLLLAGGAAFWLFGTPGHSGSPYRPALSPSTVASSSVPSTSAPVTATTSPRGVYVTTYSAACNAALVPARADLAKVKSGLTLTAAEGQAFQASLDAGSTACSTGEYITFQAKELDPYIKR